MFSILPPLHLHVVLNSLRSDTIYKVNPNVCHNSPIISIVDPDQLEFLLKKKKDIKYTIKKNRNTVETKWLSYSHRETSLFM